MHNESGRFKVKKGMVLWEIIGGIFVLAIAGGIIFFIGTMIAAKEEKLAKVREIQAASRPIDAVNVAMMPLERVDVVDTIVLPGRFEPLVSSVVSAQVEGKVVSRVKEGAEVKKGEVIASIEDTDYNNTMQEKKANYEQARQSYERKKTLRSRKINAQSELEIATALYNSTKNNYETAKLNYERCKIKSPIGGVVDNVVPEMGEIVMKNNPVATVVKLGKLKIEVGIPEKDIDFVREIDDCKIEVDAIRSVVEGKRTYLSYLQPEGTQVYILRLEVDNPKGEIRPGMYGKVEVVRQVRKNFLIPLYSVLAKDDKHYVFVESKKEPRGKAKNDPRKLRMVERKEVELGVVQGADVEIVSGLEEGDRLVVVGQRNIDEETVVNVVKDVDDIKELSN